MRNLLVVGCGDIAHRVFPLLRGRFRVYGLVRNERGASGLRRLGVVPIRADLDDRLSLRRLVGVADVVLHLAPPPSVGRVDQRTRFLLAALSQGTSPRQFVYVSTSGVYGDCGGEWIDETRRVNPQSDRARRRQDAECQIRSWASRNHVKASILRVPGIYAETRLPVDRIQGGLPAILPEDDAYSNHIHADDLAGLLLTVLRKGKSNRVYHAADDVPMKMGDFLDVVADFLGKSRLPRLTRSEAQSQVSPSLWSFMRESRRLRNSRLRQELGARLDYPSLSEVLRPSAHLE